MLKRILAVVGVVVLVAIVVTVGYGIAASGDYVDLVRSQEDVLDDAIRDLELANTVLLAGPSEDMSGLTLRSGWVLRRTVVGQVIDGVGELFQRHWWTEGDHLRKTALFEVQRSALGGCANTIGVLDVGTGCGTGETTDLLSRVRFDNGIQALVDFYRLPPSARGDSLRDQYLNEYREIVDTVRDRGRTVTFALVSVTCDSPESPDCVGRLNGR